jgi:CheY-like chemotaxis protein
MTADDGLMTEKKSKYTILVVEDNHDFALDALKAVSEKGHYPILATNLEEAIPAVGRLKPDFILSDVHFPTELGGEPVENITLLMQTALEANVPICFVTRADHHGLTERDEGYVSIKPLTMSDLMQTLMTLTQPNADKTKKAFSSVQSTDPLAMKADAKTPEIWGMAFERLLNACAQKPRPIELAIRAVSATVGVTVGVENGLPVVKTPR